MSSDKADSGQGTDIDEILGRLRELTEALRAPGADSDAAADLAREAADLLTEASRRVDGALRRIAEESGG